MAADPIFAATPRVEAQTFVNADGTTIKTVFSAGGSGSRIEAINITSDDTAAMSVNFYITFGGTDYYLGVAAVPIGSGYTTVIPVQPLSSLLPPQLDALNIPTGYDLKASMVGAVTAAKTVTVLAMGADF